MLKDKMNNTYLLQSRRTEYLKKFQKTTIPLFIEGVYSIYNNVKKNNKSRRLLLKEFQQSMVDVSRWSQDIIKNEHMRFKKHSSVLDKLIRAIFDLDLILKKDLCKNAEDFIPQPWDFVHQCYLNIARGLWKQPFLIYDINIDKLTIQQNKLKIEKIVSLCIQDTFAQYLPLDLEHDDVSNIDYAFPNSNQEVMNEDFIEKYTENNDEYGDNNDIIKRDDDDLDVVKHYVSDCNDNFKKLNLEINSNLNENLNVFQNDKQETIYVDDCDNRDNNEGNNYQEQVEIQDTNSDILNEYINVSHDDEMIESNSDIIEESTGNDSNSKDGNSDTSDVKQNAIEEDLNNDSMNFDEENETDSEEVNEVRSFHSEEVGDIDSIDSKELFISHYDTETNEEKYSVSSTMQNESKSSEIKNIIIGDNEQQYKRDNDEMQEVSDNENEHHIEHQDDIKVINIDDSKSRISSKKDALLNIKKKVKSSMYHSREHKHTNKHERYGDRIQVERKNMSFF